MVTSPWFIANCVLAILFLEWALFKIRNILKVDEDRDSKFSAFRRYDAQKKLLSRLRLYPAAPFMLLRFLSSVFLVISAYIVTRVLNFNVPAGGQPNAFQFNVCGVYHRVCCRLMAFFAGIYWYSVKKENVDYKKYLGPDWKPTDRLPSTIVANHSVWLDIFMFFVIKRYPMFTAKSAVKNFPCIGWFA